MICDICMINIYVYTCIYVDICIYVIINISLHRKWHDCSRAPAGHQQGTGKGARQGTGTRFLQRHGKTAGHRDFCGWIPAGHRQGTGGAPAGHYKGSSRASGQQFLLVLYSLTTLLELSVDGPRPHGGSGGPLRFKRPHPPRAPQRRRWPIEVRASPLRPHKKDSLMGWVASLHWVGFVQMSDRETASMSM